MTLLKKFYVLTGVLITAGLFMMGCSQNEETKENMEIRMVYANWSEGVAMTHLAAELLEKELGYTVVTKMTDIESVFRELNSNNYDVFMDAWLPNTHGGYMNQYGENLQDIGVNVEQVKTGLVVPDYVDFNSIVNLRDSDVKSIVGIGSGSGIVQATETALSVYELPQTLHPTNEAQMTDSLADAIKRRVPVVITGWTPHWIHSKYNLKFLDDPQNVYGGGDEIHALAREGFTNDHPRAALFFERFKLKQNQISGLMEEVTSNPNNEREAVRAWIQNNPQIVNEWVRGLKPERNKVM